MHLGQDTFDNFAALYIHFPMLLKQAIMYLDRKTSVLLYLSDIGAEHAAFSAHGPKVAVQSGHGF